MDGEADPERARQIVEAAAEGQRDALRMLDSIDDTRAASVMLEAAGCPEPAIRRAALISLGLIGDRQAVPVAIAGLDETDDGARRAAIECLAELGGPDAVEALAAHLAHGADVVATAMALAWLKDSRAFEALVVALGERGFSRNAYRSPAFGLSWLDDRRAVSALARHLDELADEWTAAAAADPARPAWAAHMLAASAGEALLRIGGDEATAAVERAKERFGNGLRIMGPPSPEHRPFAYHAPPDERRTVPRWSLELTPAALPVRERTTKFGGQPAWIDAPTWPLGADGGPMTFMAQFAIPGVEGMAYLFIDPSDPSDVDYSDQGAFGCLLMQPGPPPSRHLAQAHGPTYASEVSGLEGFVPRPHWRMIEYLPTLEPGFDYTDWEALRADPPGGRDDDRDWNKIGGTPRYLQNGPQDPDRWRFLFQFTAGHVGHELGDGAECYGFVDEDRRGLFLAESH